MATRRRYHELMERLALEAVQRARLGLSTNYLTLPARESFPNLTRHENLVARHLTFDVSCYRACAQTENLHGFRFCAHASFAISSRCFVSVRAWTRGGWGRSDRKRRESGSDVAHKLKLLARHNFPSFTDHEALVRKHLSKEV